MQGVESLKEQGNAFFKAQNYEQAKEKYLDSRHAMQVALQKDVSLQSKSSEFIKNLDNNIAMVYLKLEKFPQAIEYATYVLNKDPKNSKAFYRRSQAYKSSNNLVKALQDMEAAYNLEKTKDLLEQINEIKELAKADPIPIVVNMIEEGNNKYQAKQYQQSKDIFTNASQMLNSANTSEKSQELKYQIQSQIDSLDIDILYENGQYEQVVEKADQLLQKENNNFNAMFKKGNSLNKIGYDKKALKQLKETLPLAPDFASKQLIEKIIKGIQDQLD